MHLPFLGECNIYNALAAMATSYSLGIEPDDIQVGLKNNVLSVDHLEEMRSEDIEALKNTKTMPVA